MPEIRLKVYHSPSDFRTETYCEPRVTVGRDINNDIVVPEKGISRFHCLFECDEQGWRVVDLESTNGTFVNGISVKKAAIKNGDVVVVGSTRMHVLECSSGAPTAPISLRGYRVVRSIAQGKSATAPPFPKAFGLALTASEILQGAGNPRAIVKTVAARMMAGVTADVCMAYLCHPDTQMLECAAIEPSDGGPSVAADILDFVREQKTAVHIEVDRDIATQPARARAVMCAPMFDGRELLGAIALVRRETSWKEDDPDLERLAVAALTAAAALSCARSYGRLETVYLELFGAGEALPAALGEREQDRAEMVLLDSTIQKLRGALARVLEDGVVLAERKKLPQPRQAIAADLVEAARQSDLLAERLSGFLHQRYEAQGESWPAALLAELSPVLRDITGPTMAFNERVPNELPAVGVAPRVVRAAITRIVLFCRDHVQSTRLRLTAETLGSEKPIRVEGYDDIAPGQYVQIAIEAEGNAAAMDDLCVLRDKESGGLRDPRSRVAGLYWATQMLRRSGARLVVHRQDESTIVFDLYLPLVT
jgi:hypothetical protein